MKRVVAFITILLLLAVLIAACGGDGESSADATADAIRAQLAGESEVAEESPVEEVEAEEPVAEAAEEEPETAPEQPAEDDATPEPPADEPGGLTAAEATATQQALDIQATIAAREAEIAASDVATAEAVAPILAELPLYGVDPNAGRVAWIHPHLELDVEGYLQFDYANTFLATVARDFVLSADITWVTDFGTTGCGFVIRSDGDEELANQYLVVGTRGGNGRILFGVQRDGELVLDETVDIYAQLTDPSFDWQNGGTNKIVVVGRGDTFGIYSNGVFLGNVLGPEPERYEEGFVAFVALNESGTTHCEFDNAYLFQIRQ